MKLSQKRLKELLKYDPYTGLFTWIKRPSPAKKAGDIAGTIKRGAVHRGRVMIGVENSIYLAHRLAWLYMTGEWPKKEIDHIDCNQGNNKWENIRDVSRSVNAQNRKCATRVSRTGFLGVLPYGRQFKAQIGVNGRTTYLGLFKTPEQAYECYLKAKRLLHKGNTL